VKSKAPESALPPLDYQAWLSRAWNFIEKCRALPDEVYITQVVEPPATRAQIRRHLSGLARPVPRSLERWFREGSAHCRLVFNWQPQSRSLSPLQRKTAYQFRVGGQVTIGPISEIWVWFSQREILCEPLQNREDARAKHALELWQKSFPFCAFGDGDLLAVIPSDSGPEPVVYLGHELPDMACVLAPDFDEFLRRWEQLRYCDQNGMFAHLDKSGLNPSSKMANQLREWLPAK
jgi:hypothetical protein